MLQRYYFLRKYARRIGIFLLAGKSTSIRQVAGEYEKYPNIIWENKQTPSKKSGRSWLLSS